MEKVVSHVNAKIITYENFPYGGAPANFVRLLATGLSENGVEVEVLLPTGNIYGKNVELGTKKKGNLGKVKYRHLGYINHPHNYIGKLLDILFSLLATPLFLIQANRAKKYKFIISYNVHVSRMLHLLLFKILFKKKLVIVLPEYYEKPKSGLALIRWYDFYTGLKWLAKHADAFLPLSTYLKNHLEQELSIKKPTYVLPNLVDPTNFMSKEVSPHQANKITIGYTGTPTHKDGVVDLIKSFAQINGKYKKVHLLIVGDVTNGDSVIPGLKELASELGCAESITFTGLVPYIQIPPLLHSCQILALTRPSGVFAEAGFPTKLGEYFACKKPVLITEVGDIPNYFINEREVILAKPSNIQSIADGFEKLILDPELAKEIGENGYAWMNEKLSYRTSTRKVAEFIVGI